LIQAIYLLPNGTEIEVKTLDGKSKIHQIKQLIENSEYTKRDYIRKFGEHGARIFENNRALITNYHNPL
jgi:hypothetical protein